MSKSTHAFVGMYAFSGVAPGAFVRGGTRSAAYGLLGVEYAVRLSRSPCGAGWRAVSGAGGYSAVAPTALRALRLVHALETNRPYNWG